MEYDNKSILITGGTGSLGKRCTDILLKKHPGIRRLIIFSRDELKQYEMTKTFPESKYPNIRYFIGDVRDLDRLKVACANVDVIIHAAALKQVPTAEQNPFEVIKTNILGAENVISAAYYCGVKNVVALSTDKASSPINLYGATKLCSDKLFVAANNLKGYQDIKFSVVRYGNVMGSRGSIIPLFKELHSMGKSIPITDKRMTRFNITLDEAVDLILYALDNSLGGEIFVPKIKSFKLYDLVRAITDKMYPHVEIIGIRPGEKLHEEMISEHEAVIHSGNYYVILPSFSNYMDAMIKHHNGELLEGFKYTSDNNEFMTIDELKNLL